MSKLVLDFRNAGKPTYKMCEFAKAIHFVVSDGLSKVQFEDVLNSFNKCKEYIAKHVQEWDRIKQTRYATRGRHDPWYGDYWNPFACPGSDLGMDCTDYGIFPWGDS